MNAFILLLFTLLLSSSCQMKDLLPQAPKASIETSSGDDGMISFDHQKFKGMSCLECHRDTPRPAIPSHADRQKDCLQCHTPVAWKQVTNMDHTGVKACLSCHNADRPSIAPHLPGQLAASADCSSCHQNPNWQQVRFQHVPGISCNQCHQSPKTDLIPNRPPQHPSPRHTQLDCQQCHTNLNDGRDFASSVTFDYNTHAPSPTTCTSCHASDRPISSKHAPTMNLAGKDTADCSLCHSFGKSPGQTFEQNWKTYSHGFNHAQFKPNVDSCKACHTSTPANNAHIGKYKAIDCQYCHTTTAFTQRTFDYRTHANATSCNLCHKTKVDDRPATLTHNTGLRATNDCASCHAFSSSAKWKNFSPFNHSLVSASTRCDSCHAANQLTVPKKPTLHIPTTSNCNACHTTSSFTSYTFAHSASTSNCASCHTGAYTANGHILGKNAKASHPSTTAQCSTCHNSPASYTSWANNSLPSNHISLTLVNNQTCSTCHSAGSTSSWPGYTHSLLNNSGLSSCGTCHDGTHTKTVNGSQKILGKSANHQVTSADCSSCHAGFTSWSSGASLPSNHIPLSAVTYSSCATCHTGPTKSTWPGFSHGLLTATASQNCTLCHSGSFTRNGKILGRPVNMTIGPTGNTKAIAHTTRTTCHQCHDSINTTFTQAKNYDHYGYTVNSATTDCKYCHEVKQPVDFAKGVNLSVEGSVMKHNPTTNCNQCHSKSTIPIFPSTNGGWLH